MKRNKIQNDLFALQELSVQKLSQSLTPTIDKKSVIGIRIPKLRAYAKQLYRNGDVQKFITSLPHQYFEENTLHGLIINEMQSYDEVIDALNTFLPYVDNWATCDAIRPKVFKKNKKDLVKQIELWIHHTHEYTVRFGIEMLMIHYLDDGFKKKYLSWVKNVHRDEYYINMMRAWYFATALAKQYSATIPFIENKQLDDWTHNKTIQKAIESYRINDPQKEFLKTLIVEKKAQVNAPFA